MRQSLPNVRSGRQHRKLSTDPLLLRNPLQQGLVGFEGFLIQGFFIELYHQADSSFSGKWGGQKDQRAPESIYCAERLPSDSDAYFFEGGRWSQPAHAAVPCRADKVFKLWAPLERRPVS
jgi:hypothetical protein